MDAIRTHAERLRRWQAISWIERNVARSSRGRLYAAIAILLLTAVAIAIARSAGSPSLDPAAGPVGQGNGASLSTSVPASAAQAAPTMTARLISEASPAAANRATGASGTTGATSSVAPAAQAAPTFDRKVIRNATLALTVNDVEAAVAYVRDTAAGAGGYVFASSTSLQQGRQQGQITLHVPFDRFDQVMTLLRGYGGVVQIDGETTTSQDVTQEYVDAESRVRNLEATERSMAALLDKATTMTEVIAIQDQVTRVRGEIETLKGRMNYLTNLAALSTITITLTPYVAPVTREPEPEPVVVEEPAKVTIPDAARAAWQASLAVLEQVAIVVVAVVVFGWWLAVLAFAGWLLSRLVRGLRGGRRAVVPVAPGGGMSASEP